jgi:hypothetical protein
MPPFNEHDGLAPPPETYPSVPTDEKIFYANPLQKQSTFIGKLFEDFVNKSM